MNVGDVNNDGVLDLISAAIGTNKVNILIGNGDGSFRENYQLDTSGNPRETQLADINQDGRLDLVAVSNSQDLSVFLGNGDGTFGPRSTFFMTAGTGGGAFMGYLDAADFNGDGVIDLAISPTAGAPLGIAILTGNGDGTFRAPSSYLTGTGAREAQAYDVNEDGILDLVVGIETGDANSSGVGVLIGNGDGTFRNAITYRTGIRVSSIHLSDYNGDGIMDVAAKGVFSTENRVIFGNSDGSFRQGTSFSPTSSPSPADFTASDINGDGVPDIIAAGGTNNLISIMLGNADSSGRRNNFVYTLDLTTIQGARSALDWSKQQVQTISREMGSLGAYQSRLGSTLSILDISRINSDAAASRIQDADVATEAANLAATQIRQQLGQAVLAQANQQPRIALNILGNI